MERFREELRAAAAPVWEAIHRHPFVREVGGGAISPERFGYFICQDYLYLQDFARALQLTGAKAAAQDDLETFAEHAANCVRVERALHAGLAARAGVSERLGVDPPGPATLAYTRHLLATCRAGSLAVGLAALLPCYWIYREVGLRLARSLPADPLCAEWISVYAGDVYGGLVEAQLALADRLGPSLGSLERARAREAFLLSSRYEWMFWEQAYRLEKWPL
ncbi:MAG: thiaminase II [Candidatus Tectomicrobia bacterium]|uniref:Aminopyrimidine aminohydrolase n=1 Tax=Tectimicrobiota bacterium TaxID=2528274 RepID=A0A932I190_UNCTE|nr:thiaminase II [Candidatus Tectomicrobia bacterium]